MERQFRETALQGNAESLSDLLEKDNQILDRVVVSCIRESPSHIADTPGHVDFVKLLLSRKPELARLKDPRRHTPLHLAAARGHLEIVKALRDQDSGSSLCLARDTDGMIPLHLAAIKGQVDAIKELVTEKPGTVLQLVGRGEIILHLCVKHRRLNVLEQLLDLMSNPDKFVNVSAFFCSQQAG
ncbi:PREDICTED: ankyrin repeat-containing protein ITN1-like [Nelumbo nucifera]|uniref:Ankyrin repeat-containing protein ITN1-like n=1 Tax=Nelumbo nucifera TaxID=4432 RepID=A0A1U8B2Q8_NELNU|nr:PREDICTED: ankyrin repeat-containing protein ITN1-like [Nelumbo nucifera]